MIGTFRNAMKILLGVTGCIAAYKSAELLRLLQKHGHEVFVVMTDNSRQFITPLTLETLSQHPVITGMFPQLEGSPAMDSPLAHIHLVNSVELLPGGSCNREYHWQVCERHCRRLPVDGVSCRERFRW